MSSPGAALLVHLRWPIADPVAAPLTDQATKRLVSYLPRYAETLTAQCLAVGGMPDHLHLLLALPRTKSLQSVEEELLRASQRFVREVLGNTLFAWAAERTLFQSVSPGDQESVAAYIVSQADRHATQQLWEAFEGAVAETVESPPSVKTSGTGDDEELPDWLRAAMVPRPS